MGEKEDDLANLSERREGINDALRTWNLGKGNESGISLLLVLFLFLPVPAWYCKTQTLMTKPSCPFQEHLVFTVCLSYQYSGLEDTIEEKQEVNVGKPLIAKLDIHRGLGRKTCFQTCLMCNGPYQSSASTAAGAGAGQYHSSPDSFLGVYHSHLGSSGDVMPPDSCHCSRTADALLSSHHTHHYSCRFGRSNVPVETTEELPFTFSDGLRIAEK